MCVISLIRSQERKKGAAWPSGKGFMQQIRLTVPTQIVVFTCFVSWMANEYKKASMHQKRKMLGKKRKQPPQVDHLQPERKPPKYPQNVNQNA